ncbi:MAG: N-acetylglucosaminyl-diphospho-decaprenol L-rhamnosyltransferase [Gaiellaceae bacterium]|nr:N-acetylglucosaminyl-diphospho-decaprenol L-rhamnosyltransferase [Gaiellaceae bacterium]
MTTPSIDVVVPVHNHRELTQRCLEHLRAQTVPHTVIVSDNGSTDGTPQHLRNAFAEVRVVELGANLGFPVACNRGVQAGSGAIVVLLNNDVDCRPDFLERLVAPFAGDERLGSAAARLLAPGEKHIESFGLAVDPTFAGYPRLRGSPAAEARHELVLVGPSGAAGAYRRGAWEEVGGLDEGVFFYGEDVDIALRLRAAGWSTAAVSDAVAIHAGSASASHRSAWQRYQGGFARGYFLRRYGVLRSRVAPRAATTEALVVLGDAIVFSHDLAALRGRIAGWHAAAGKGRVARPPQDAIDRRITFLKSVALRVGVYTEATTSS